VYLGAPYAFYKKNLLIKKNPTAKIDCSSSSSPTLQGESYGFKAEPSNRFESANVVPNMEGQVVSSGLRKPPPELSKG
jgi:hypothetical protein